MDLKPQLRLRFYGDPCLRTKSITVEEVGPGERMLIEAMIEAMHKYEGVGLAAPQVGINQQIFVADIGEGPIAVINPEIVEKEGSEVMEEGCLSIPGVLVKVKRPERIIVRYKNEESQTVERELSELMARVFQHETDHLHAKLIVDYANLAEKAKIKKQLKELEQQHKDTSHVQD